MLRIQETIVKSLIGLVGGNQDRPLVKYSPEWLQSLSDAELYRVREPIRKQAKYGPGYDPWAERVLDAIDEEEIRRMYIQYRREHPNPTTHHYHSEHGWHLPEDD